MATSGDARSQRAPLTEHRAAAQLRHPRQFARTSFRSLRASLPVARRIFSRDLRARYRLSVLGYAWMVLPAIAQTAIWLFLNESDILNSGDTSIPLPLFILTGTLLWQTFVDALFAPANQLSASTSMLAHVNFPPESLLLAGLADAALASVVRLTIAIPLLIGYEVVPGWGLALAPLGLASLLLLGFAIGLAIAPFGALYQDLTRAVTVAAGFWLLITPVAYVLPSGAATRWLIRLNPVTPPLTATRDWLTAGPLVPGPTMAIVVVASAVLLVLSWIVFRLAVPHLVDRIGT